MWCEALEVCWPYKSCSPSCWVQCKWFSEEVIKSSENILFSKGIAESQHSICKPYTLVEPPACSGGLFCSNSSDLLWWVKQFCDLTSVPMDKNTMASDHMWVKTLSFCETIEWLRWKHSDPVDWNIELQASWLAVMTNSCHVLFSYFGKLSFPSRSSVLNGWNISFDSKRNLQAWSPGFSLSRVRFFAEACQYRVIASLLHTCPYPSCWGK